MNDQSKVSGNTTIDNEVIDTIVRMTTTETPGVNRIFATSSNPGVKVRIADGTVSADVYVVLDQRKNTIDVGRDLQKKISRAIQEMIGMEVGCINVHIEDYEFPEEASK